MSGSAEGDGSLDDAEVGAPPVKLDLITLTDQFAAERLHGGHMPHQVPVNNGGVANDFIPPTQLRLGTEVRLWSYFISYLIE